MKTPLPFLFSIFSIAANAQITTPIIKAGFGVDADLKCNYFNGFVQAGNDDWYSNGNVGPGQFVIDTTGAAAIKAGYLSDVSPFPKRMTSFYRTMSKPSFSVVNNRLWLDAIFVRDYHGNDTTVFTAGADKNGDSPANWSGGIQGIPDKNDILDMYVHVRRAGPITTDSLWMFGGLSLDNVTGNRYFDFEMYQTDIYYDRASARWYGYGADAGHTSWLFDAAGNVTRPGDIIFSAEYQSSSLTNIEARIWTDRASLSITPASFSWSGQFDGANSGSQYGYASILPKVAGTFYAGLQCGNGEWAGAFSLVLQNNVIATNYIAKQFMEFSVNLSKLGLDPVTLLGGDICGSPFNRIVVKTRASASFTAELKDFVAPLDLFLAPRADAITDVPLYCGTMGVSNIFVQNPSPSSVYTWTTIGGNILSPPSGTSITVNAPGKYIVKQQLAAGCNPYAYDTVNIVFDSTCTSLENSITFFKGNIINKMARLNWTTNANNGTQYFEVQHSINGKDFETLKKIVASPTDNSIGEYSFEEDIAFFKTPFIYYRLKIRMGVGAVFYSNVLRLNLPIDENDLLMFPNPAGDNVQLALSSSNKQELKIAVFDFAGFLIETKTFFLKQGTNILSVNTEKWKSGAYVLQLTTQHQNIRKKLIVNRQMAAKGF
jgi:hypothetical protein